MESKQSQFTINNKYRSSYVTRVSELPNFPTDETVVGLLLGVSRNRPPSRESNSPYTLHMTDFSHTRFDFPEYFGGRNFHMKGLERSQTYDIVTFPGVFEAISRDVADVVDLHEKVRCYKYSEGRPHYEDEWNPEELRLLYLKLGIDLKHITQRRRLDEWLLAKYNIWIEVRIRGKQYKDKMEFVCLNNFCVIPAGEVKPWLVQCGLNGVWDEYARYSVATSTPALATPAPLLPPTLEAVVQTPSPASFSEDDFSVSEVDLHSTYRNDEPRQEKRRKLAPAPPAPLSPSRRFAAITGYSLLGELVDTDTDTPTVQYAPQYVVVRPLRILRTLHSYVYMHHRQLGVKRVHVVVADERGTQLVLFVRENQLCSFLGISVADFKFFEDLDEAIKTRVEALPAAAAAGPDGGYHGMVVSRAQLAPGVHRWCWEYSTAEIV